MRRSVLLLTGSFLALVLAFLLGRLSGERTDEPLDVRVTESSVILLQGPDTVPQRDVGEEKDLPADVAQLPTSGLDDTPAQGGATLSSISSAPNEAVRNESSTRSQSVSAQKEVSADAPVLSDYVFSLIEQIQQLQMEERWDEALNELNALYNRYDELNDFERMTLLNFYTNVLLRFEMWPEAIGAFSRMLEIPDLRPDVGARALMALGQLHAREAQYAASVTYLEAWQEVTADMDIQEQTVQRVEELLASSRAQLQASRGQGAVL